MNQLPPWILPILIASIPGGINVWNGYLDLRNRFTTYIQFRPLQSVSFWMWVIVETATPWLIFWFVEIWYPTRQGQWVEINPVLVGKAVGFGFGFTAILNAKLFGEINIKQVHDWVIQAIYDRIAAEYHYQAAAFWVDLNQKLLQQPEAKLNHGLDFLYVYFDSNVLTFSDDQRERYRERVRYARSLKSTAEKSDYIIRLLRKDVRNKDLANMLRNFGLPESFIQGYFPKS
jgi:hypothetical protein